MEILTGLVIGAAVFFLLGTYVGAEFNDREWMESGDMQHGSMSRGGREFLVVDLDDPGACNAAREQIEDEQDRRLRAL